MIDYTNTPTEQLEFDLPIRIQHHEPRERPCPDCNKPCELIAVDYIREFYIYDDYGLNNKKHRTYQISYNYVENRHKILWRGERTHDLRAALIEALEVCEKNGWI